MVLVLAIGDLHIPLRKGDLPPKFKALLLPGKIQHILCPGDLCVKEVQEYLKTICSDLHITRGEFDKANFPETKAQGSATPAAASHVASSPPLQVLNIGDFRFGLCHGHQVTPWGDADSLASLARTLDVDVLVSGHTGEFRAARHGDRLLINPGSATGAPSPLRPVPARPSFVLMDVDGSRLVAYVYQLIEGEVKVDKIEFYKGR